MRVTPGLTDPAEAERFVKHPAAILWPAPLAPATAPSSSREDIPPLRRAHQDQKPAARFPTGHAWQSSVPKEEVDRINAAGVRSRVRWAWTPIEYLPAARLGVTKVNIDTDGRLVWDAACTASSSADKPAEFDFRPPGKIFIEEYARFIASRNRCSARLDNCRRCAPRCRNSAAVPEFRRIFQLTNQPVKLEGISPHVFLQKEISAQFTGAVSRRQCPYRPERRRPHVVLDNLFCGLGRVPMAATRTTPTPRWP